MEYSGSTCWLLIQRAASGEKQEREEFARRYEPLVRAYLALRWRNTPWVGELDDAVQEVFLECFEPNGLLERVEPGRGGGFRAFLYGAVRIVAWRFERRIARSHGRRSPDALDLDSLERDTETLSRVFDREWARALLREARLLHRRKAEQAGPEALKRADLLRLRFQENMPIRKIAGLWHVDAGALHVEYRRARKEFKSALTEVVTFHHPGNIAEIEENCREILKLVKG